MDTRALKRRFRVQGGPSAPRRARLALAPLLEGRLTRSQRSDAELIVSELVTNSVRHVPVGPDRTIVVDLLLLRGHLRLSVVDPGGERLPRFGPPEPKAARRFGLPVVAALSTSFGVARDGRRVTRVWSELPLRA